MRYVKMKAWLLVSLLIVIRSENVSISEEQIEERIVKGYFCKEEEYSHIVAIRNGDQLACVGSLISADWILIAAHCCERMKTLSDYSITINLEDLNGDIKGQQYSNIERIYVHKDFKMEPRNCDICVIKTTRRFRIFKRAKISKLASTEDFLAMQQGKKCKHAIVMGYGEQQTKQPSRSARWSHQDPSPRAQCVPLKLLKKENCRNILGSRISDSMFCVADASKSGRDACQGDPGGPVFCDGVQIGLISAGFGCGVSNYPGLCSRVDIFRDFIQKLQMQGFRETHKSESSGVVSIHVPIIVMLFASCSLNLTYL